MTNDGKKLDLWPYIPPLLPDAMFPFDWDDPAELEVYTVVETTLPSGGLFIAEERGVAQRAIESGRLKPEYLVEGHPSLRWIKAKDTMEARRILEDMGLVKWRRPPLTMQERAFYAATYFATWKKKGGFDLNSRDYWTQAFCIDIARRSMSRLTGNAAKLSPQAQGTFARRARNPVKDASPTQIETFVRTHPTHSAQDAVIETMRDTLNDSSHAFELRWSTSLDEEIVRARILSAIERAAGKGGLRMALSVLTECNNILREADETTTTPQKDNDR